MRHLPELAWMVVLINLIASRFRVLFFSFQVYGDMVLECVTVGVVGGINSLRLIMRKEDVADDTLEVRGTFVQNE